MALPGDRDLKVPTDSVRRAASELNRLTQTAMDEVESTAKKVAPSGLLLAAGAGLALTGASVLAVSAALSLPLRAGKGPLVLGVALLGSAAGCLVAGARALPTKLLRRTRSELRKDLAATGEFIG